jgi:hypothetical protein
MRRWSRRCRFSHDWRYSSSRAAGRGAGSVAMGSRADTPGVSYCGTSVVWERLVTRLLRAQLPAAQRLQSRGGWLWAPYHPTSCSHCAAVGSSTRAQGEHRARSRRTSATIPVTAIPWLLCMRLTRCLRPAPGPPAAAACVVVPRGRARYWHGGGEPGG